MSAKPADLPSARLPPTARFSAAVSSVTPTATSQELRPRGITISAEKHRGGDGAS
jgi:hypothetical protein